MDVPGQAPESSGARASTAKRKRRAGAEEKRTKGRKITDKELTEYLQATQLAYRLAAPREVLEMRLKSTNLDPGKAAECLLLLQVVGTLKANAPRSTLRAFAKTCGFNPRRNGERLADSRERLLKAWEEAVGSFLTLATCSRPLIMT